MLSGLQDFFVTECLQVRPNQNAEVFSRQSLDHGFRLIDDKHKFCRCSRYIKVIVGTLIGCSSLSGILQSNRNA